jgi:hypothetical protein
MTLTLAGSVAGVAAIDMVMFYYRTSASSKEQKKAMEYDPDHSGHHPKAYARHGRLEIPCSLYICGVSWVDFHNHGWMGRELDYQLCNARGQVKDKLEQHAGYAPLCTKDKWAQSAMKGCIAPVQFRSPAGQAIVGLKWSPAGKLVGVETEALVIPQAGSTGKAVTPEYKAADKITCTSMSMFNVLMSAPNMAKACCPTASNCPGGTIRKCSPQCAAYFLPTYNACAEFLSGNPAGSMLRRALDPSADACDDQH